VTSLRLALSLFHVEEKTSAFRDLSVPGSRPAVSRVGLQPLRISAQGAKRHSNLPELISLGAYRKNARSTKDVAPLFQEILEPETRNQDPKLKRLGHVVALR
jgi:hypothetical protein